MPTISVFYGIIIRMFWDEHAPPHFHASYGEFKASINIGTLEMIEGDLPKRALKLVLRQISFWASALKMCVRLVRLKNRKGAGIVKHYFELFWFFNRTKLTTGWDAHV